MTTTARLSLPLIAANQAQKHITHNEAVIALDGLVQLSVKSASAPAPPPAVSEGDLYLVAPGGTDAWSGQDRTIAAWSDGTWTFQAPREGWRCWIEDEARLVVFTGATWQDVRPAPDGSIRIAELAVNAEPSSENRLTVSAQSILFDHDGGDQQVKVNKAATVDTASLLFQSGYTGHAELGLTGSNDLSFKVSDDGAAWVYAMHIDAATGQVGIGTSAPEAPLHLNGTFLVSGGARLSGSAHPHLYRLGGNLNIEGRTDGGAGGQIRLATEGTERVCIAADGHVGIGTTSPEERVDVAGLTRAHGFYSGEILIAPDGVATVTPPVKSGLIVVSNNPYSDYPQSHRAGAALFDVGITPWATMAFGGGYFGVFATDVTGTTGTPTHVTVGVVEDAIRIESRLTSTTAIRYTIIG
ncbi:DUF2793 domain-containing protein [Stappia sp.]|uniref:DUF2793 domain-containing protein n=1 Tax=Stappia sp. TaxID=1870903 RepID=UPI0032D8F83E